MLYIIHYIGNKYYKIELFINILLSQNIQTLGLDIKFQICITLLIKFKDFLAYLLKFKEVFLSIDILSFHWKSTFHKS